MLLAIKGLLIFPTKNSRFGLEQPFYYPSLVMCLLRANEWIFVVTEASMNFIDVVSLFYNYYRTPLKN